MAFAKQAKAQNINIVNKFESTLAELLAVLGKSDVNVMAPGTAMNIYKSAGSLNSGEVAENGEIPASAIKMELEKTVELTYSKYRKLTGIESVGKLGYDIAVLGSNEAMLRDVQAKVRKSIYDGIATGTGTAAGATFQAAVANAWGKVTEAFEGEAATPVFFANPMDVAGYLGTANIITQSAFGMNYVKDFMGLGNVLIDSNVPAGTVYGTACENIDVVAANVAAIPGMDLHTDRSGIIAVHNGAKYDHGALESVAYCGLAVFPVFLDRVVKATISA
jgi:hypothetical protein